MSQKKNLRNLKVTKDFRNDNAGIIYTIMPPDDTKSDDESLVEEPRFAPIRDPVHPYNREIRRKPPKPPLPKLKFEGSFINPTLSTRVEYKKHYHPVLTPEQMKYVMPEPKRLKRKKAEERQRQREVYTKCEYSILRLPSPVNLMNLSLLEMQSPELSKARVMPSKPSVQSGYLYPDPPTKDELDLHKPKSGIYVNVRKDVLDSDAALLAEGDQTRPKKKKPKTLPEGEAVDEPFEWEDWGEDYLYEGEAEGPFQLDKSTAIDEDRPLRMIRRVVDQTSATTSLDEKDFVFEDTSWEKIPVISQLVQTFRAQDEEKKRKKRKFKKGTLESHSYTKLKQQTICELCAKVVQGSIHQGDENFSSFSRDKQGICVPIAAMCYAKLRGLKNPLDWTEKHIDDIIEYADALYIDSISGNHLHKGGELLPEDVQKFCQIQDMKVKFTIDDPDVNGHIRSTEKRIYNITKGLSIFFNRHKRGLLQTDLMDLGIWKKRKYFYIIDGHPRRKDCYTDPNGKAALIILENLKSVVSVLLDRTNLENSPFLLSKITITKIMCQDDEEIECDVKGTYNILSDKKAVLMGTFNLTDKCFCFTRNKQALPMAISCLVYARISQPSSWKRKTIDKIMVIGNQLYIECAESEKVIDQELSIDNIPALFTVGPYITEIFIYANYIIDNLYKKGVCTLKRVLEIFFDKNTSAIIQIGPYTIACWFQRNMFYYFDPYSRNTEGFKCRNGAACVSMNCDVNTLIETLTANFDDKEAIFYVHALKVIKINRDPTMRKIFPKKMSMKQIPLDLLKNVRCRKSKKKAIEKPIKIDFTEYAMKKLLAGDEPGASVTDIASNIGSLQDEYLPPFMEKPPPKEIILTEREERNIADLDSPTLSETQFAVERPQTMGLSELLTLMDLDALEMTQEELEQIVVEEEQEYEDQGMLGIGEGEGLPEEEEDFYMVKSKYTSVNSSSLESLHLRQSEVINTDVSYCYNILPADELPLRTKKDVDHVILIDEEIQAMELKRETHFKTVQDDELDFEVQIIFGEKNMLEYLVPIVKTAYEQATMKDVTSVLTSTGKSASFQASSLVSSKNIEPNIFENFEISSLFDSQENLKEVDPDLKFELNQNVNLLAPYVCIMAVAYSNECPLYKWTKKTVDFVLKNGAELFDSFQVAYDRVEDFHLEFSRYKIDMTLENLLDTYVGTKIIETDFSEKALRDLLENYLFNKSISGILVTKQYSCVIFFKKHMLYLFEVFGVCKHGKVDQQGFKGPAALMRFKNFDTLILRILQNRKLRLSEEEKDVEYTRIILLKPNITKIGDELQEKVAIQKYYDEDGLLVEPEITQSKELAKASNFIDLPDGSQIIRGRYDVKQYSPDADLLAPYICIMAAAVAGKYQVSTWSPDIVDYVLRCGSELHQKSKYQFLEVAKLEIPRVALGKTDFRLEIDYRFDSPLKQRILEVSLEKILHQNGDWAIIVSQEYSCSCYYKNGLFYLYDPYASNEVGLSEGPFSRGLASFSRFTDLPSLATRIVYNKQKREQPEKVSYSRFVLSTCKVRYLQPEQTKAPPRRPKRKEPEAKKAVETAEDGADFGEEEEEEVENKVGFQNRSGYWVVEGTRYPTSPTREDVSDILKADHFVCICVCLTVISVPIKKWDTLKVNRVINQGQHIYSHAENLEHSEKRTIKNILIGKHFFDIIVKPIDVARWRGPHNITTGLKFIFTKRKFALVQFPNCCVVLYKEDKNDDAIYIFDPYAYTFTIPKTDDEDEKTMTIQCGWTMYTKPKQLIKRLKEIAPKDQENSFVFYSFEVISVKKAPKKVLLTHKAMQYKLERAKPAEIIGRPFHEQENWLDMHKAPWSRIQEQTACGKIRNSRDSKWHNWDIEYENDLFSLVGTLHITSRKFNVCNRGKQTLCNLVVSIAMTNIYELSEWTDRILDSVLYNGDSYFTECVKDIHEHNYEIAMDDLLEDCSIFPYNFKVAYTPAIEGTIFLSSKTKFNLYKALRYFFENYESRCGVLICTKGAENPKRMCSFGKIQESEYFVYDCQAFGPPMFMEKEGASYILRMTTLARLLHCLVLTLKGGDFFIYDVETYDFESIEPKKEDDDDKVDEGGDVEVDAGGE
nr:uncharacterized protein LOC111428977 [Onthophagus taurus]